jgi:hypothetical protein
MQEQGAVVQNILETRRLVIEPSEYTCPVTGDIWKRTGFEIMCSDDLFHTGRSYSDSLVLVPQGYRMAAHELIAYLAQETKRIKEASGNPRGILNYALFERQINGNPYRWEYTHVLLKPANSADDFTKYVEIDAKGRKHSRVDIFHKDMLHAAGALMPWGRGVKVVEINPVLGIPSVVSDGQEPDHVMHSYFDETLNSVVVDLGGRWHGGENGSCLNFDASWGPSNAYPDDAFRLVQGSLDDIPLPSVERAIKDQRSYEIGLEKGLRQGRLEGIEVGKRIERGMAIRYQNKILRNTRSSNR